MAISKKGILSAPSGKISDKVFYRRQGQDIVSSPKIINQSFVNSELQHVNLNMKLKAHAIKNIPALVYNTHFAPYYDNLSFNDEFVSFYNRLPIVSDSRLVPANKWGDVQNPLSFPGGLRILYPSAFPFGIRYSTYPLPSLLNDSISYKLWAVNQWRGVYLGERIRLNGVQTSNGFPSQFSIDEFQMFCCMARNVTQNISLQHGFVVLNLDKFTA